MSPEKFCGRNRLYLEFIKTGTLVEVHLVVQAIVKLNRDTHLVYFHWAVLCSLTGLNKNQKNRLTPKPRTVHKNGYR